MLIRINQLLIDTQWIQCMRQTLDRERCQAMVGIKGIVEVATDELGNIKFDATCGTHLNKMAGDDVRFNVRLNAIASATLVKEST